MRKFMINVNGSSYEVEVEEIRDGSVVTQPVPAAPVAAPKAASAPAAKPAAPKAAPAPVAAGSTNISAPMPGTILSVAVKAGDSVSEGQVLCILEAMKMENEIVAPRAGTVASVSAAQGQSVNSGDVLVSLA